LQARGLLNEEGKLTAAGTELRCRIEDMTDELAYAPWRTLSDDEADDVAKVAKAVRDAIRSADLFPTGAFGARYGQHR
jgi:hypothetical protein